MKHAKKVLGMLAMLLVFAGMPVMAASTTNAKSYALKTVTEAPTMEGSWTGSGTKVRYRLETGSYLKSRWVNVEDKIYYLNSKGYRTKGWVSYRKNLYYLNKKGELLTESWLSKKYYFKADGKRAKGLTTIGEQQFYFDAKTGVVKNGWIKIGKNRFYFKKNVGMQKAAWVKVSGKYYYVDETGRQLRSKWLTLGDKQYYLEADGVRATGYTFIKDKCYYFKKNGEYDASVKATSAVVNPKKPMVALTFDDGPGPYTDRLLNCLQKNGARATFFMVGSSVPKYKNTVKRMAKMGCELGNHSYDHPAFTKLSAAQRQSQISRTNANIKAACGKLPTLCRLPYGDGASNGGVLGSLGLPSIYWSIDTMDWANTGNSQHTVNETLNYVKSGDIVLMHDIHLATVQAAERIIPALKARGYQMVTVSELAKYKGKQTLKKGTTYYNFK